MTQLSHSAFIPKLFSMAGKAILTNEIMNVRMKDVVATTANIEICFLLQSIRKWV